MIIISQGDILGIGWKFILNDLYKNFLKHIHSFIIIGYIPISQIKIIEKKFHIFLYNDLIHENIKKIQNKAIFCNLGIIHNDFDEHLVFAKYSYNSFIKAIHLTKIIPKANLVTLPVSKERILQSGIKFYGHTEVLQKEFNVKTFMCMFHEKFSVIPLTNHIPVKKISSLLKKVNFYALGESLLFYKKLFLMNKKIALLGLNPHAGENGKIGNEEAFLQKKILSIKKNVNTRRENISIEGPYAADSFFMSHNIKHYGLVICCYHDQALIPFKSLFNYEGINITLNLPILRTSPDHGPAYSLEYQKNADNTSIKNAISFCLKWGPQWKHTYSSL